MSSFIIMGKTSYTGNFWFIHKDLYTIIDVVILIITTVNLCALSQLIFTFNKQSIIILCLIAAFLISPLYIILNNLNNGLTTIRYLSYLRDKIRLFYFYNNIPEQLPQFAKISMCFSYIFFSVHPSEWCRPEETNNTIEGATFIPEKKLAYILKRDYYSIVYKIKTDDINTEIHFSQTNRDALNYFKQNGGSYEKLRTGKYKFSDLEKKEFVTENKSQ